MSNDIIKEAFSSAEAPRVIVRAGAIKSIPTLLSEINARSVFVFADVNTYSVAGESVLRLLREAGIKAKEYVFSESPLKPNEAAVGFAAMHFDPSVDAVIAVGSGVINDISKIVANLSGKKYIIVATAPSMDGYASATSSMSVGGLKVSLPSKCADVIIGDCDILRNAPMKMMLSGLGDMLAKYVAVCEWRISALINGEAYSPRVADMVRRSLQKCIRNADGLLRREDEAVRAVFEGLILCGLAMKLAESSRPASGIEHYLSHIWDMRAEEFGTPAELHGIQCAVGTCISVKVYEQLRSVKPSRERALKYAAGFEYPEWKQRLQKFLGRGAEAMIALEEKEKKYDREKHTARLDTIIEKWDDILAVMSEELPSSDSLTELCNRVGLPMSMESIGLDPATLPMTFKAAKDIRDKYVLPRLCFDLGILDDIVF